MNPTWWNLLLLMAMNTVLALAGAPIWALWLLVFVDVMIYFARLEARDDARK